MLTKPQTHAVGYSLFSLVLGLAACATEAQETTGAATSSGASSSSSSSSGSVSSSSSSSGSSGSSGGVGPSGGKVRAAVEQAPYELLPSRGYRLVAAWENTCLVTPQGHVACWGSNETGQLGLGDLQDRSTPQWIPGVEDAVDVAISWGAMCVLHSDRTVSCSGMNAYGELATSTTPSCPSLGDLCSKVLVKAEVPGATQIVAGPHRFCEKLASTGEIACWGQMQLGDTSGRVPSATTVSYSHSCLIVPPEEGQDPSRNVTCFGVNGAGQLGVGTLQNGAPAPVSVGVQGGFVSLASGVDFTCGVGAAGDLLCWGTNFGAALGVGDTSTEDYPEDCPGAPCSTIPRPLAIPPVRAVAAHYYYSCAATEQGDVYCWGTPSHTGPLSAGECYNGAPGCVPVPTPIQGVSQAIAVAVGGGHGCALTASFDVVCWGLDSRGQLGRGDEGAFFEEAAVQVTFPPEPNN